MGVVTHYAHILTWTSIAHNSKTTRHTCNIITDYSTVVTGVFSTISVTPYNSMVTHVTCTCYICTYMQKMRGIQWCNPLVMNMYMWQVFQQKLF